jgi:hypothetical protein
MKGIVALRIALKLLLAGIFLSAFTVVRAMAVTPVISAYPLLSSRLVGEDFTVTIRIAGVTRLYGWSVDLRWDPEILSLTEVTEGPFMKDFGPETFLATMINNTFGYLRADSSFSHPVPPSGANGEGALAYVTFVAKSTGQTALRFAETDIITAEGAEIWHQTRDGYFDNRIFTTYNELVEDCSSLLSNYTRLQEDYARNADELNLARNINYLLIVTVVALITTTAYIALRKHELKGA